MTVMANSCIFDTHFSFVIVSSNYTTDFIMLCETRMCRSLELLGLGLCDSTCVNSSQADHRRTPKKLNYFCHDFSKIVG